MGINVIENGCAVCANDRWKHYRNSFQDFETRVTWVWVLQWDMSFKTSKCFLIPFIIQKLIFHSNTSQSNIFSCCSYASRSHFYYLITHVSEHFNLLDSLLKLKMLTMKLWLWVWMTEFSFTS